MAGSEAQGDLARRDAMRRLACLAGALGSGAWPPLAWGAPQRYRRSLLVDRLGDPFRASSLKPGQAQLFNYPFIASPVFLLAFDSEIRPIELQTEARQSYASPAGVGPRGAIVAFSAICAHQLMYPTPQISFIGLRKGFAGEPAQVIHCCGDQSRYDPAAGARVIGGPAPQPLAAVLLEWDAKRDQLHAVGVQGGEMFPAFFEKYAFKLETELGSRSKALTGGTTIVQPAAAYSRQWQTCRG